MKFLDTGKDMHSYYIMKFIFWIIIDSDWPKFYTNYTYVSHESLLPNLTLKSRVLMCDQRVL